MAHSPAKSALDVGTVIGGTYTIEGLLGRGGMGAVFAAGHARLPGKKVAIKVLHAEVATAESLARFRREAEIASRLGHPNIVEVHDFNVLPDGTPYLVLEYLPGESLARRLERGNLSIDETFAIVRQVASALAAAHREGIVHRDLKPQNVFLVPTEVDGHIVERTKVLDFGISKIRGSQTVQTQDTAILGTPQYMAPEQATGNHAAVDASTDVFALGVMIYEMLSGEPAFNGASIPEVVFKVVYEEAVPLADRVPGLPAHIAAAVHRAMAKKQDDRFPGVAELVQALTGSPLVTARRPIAIAPGDGTGASVTTAPDSAVQTQDAYAQTVGSGDHAGQVGLATAQTMASGDHSSAARDAAGPAATGGGGVPRAATTAAPGGAPMPVRAMQEAGAVTAAERRSARDRRATGEPAAGGVAMAPPEWAADRRDAIAPSSDARGDRRESPTGAVHGRWRRWLAILVAMLAAGAAVAVGMFQLERDRAPAVALHEPAAGPAPAIELPRSEARPAMPEPPDVTRGGAPPPPPTPPPAPTVDDTPVEEKPEQVAAAPTEPERGDDPRPARSRPRPVKAGSPPPDQADGERPVADGEAPDEPAAVGEAPQKDDAPPVEAEPTGEAGPGPSADDPDATAPLAAQLVQAEAALREDPEEGLRLAKRILNQHPGNPQAWSIRARAHCRLDDREAALAALRKLEGKPLVRRRALKACKVAGIEP